MIPSGSSITAEKLESVQQPSRTYRLDLINKRMAGVVDGLEAVRQAVLKILQTDRFDHYVYSGDYGSEISRLGGGTPLLMQSQIAHRIKEALLQDDRISDVMDIQITVSGDNALATFTVVTDFGNFTSEVKSNV
ncbi:DUF2634 domain-containing protein [Cohnella abietis]|uniref:Phage protein n=1 Tax=Cohnella abietis TaxID=2507935 RepID=A0A3T1D1S0_9BACL|nr:DUF2634 domain-containing protein [Cohnella abietis]BBI32053.1 hypothetical protein KCTCHS21_14520 [Cohnella abietis]